MKKIEEFLNLIGASEDEALSAMLGSFGVSQPNAIVQYWKQHKAYGNSAPSTKEVLKVFVSNDYRCQICSSQRRLSLDHINGNSKDHRVSNLQLLCMSCNRGKSKKATKNKDHQLAIYNAAIELCNELKRFPTYKEVEARAQVQQIGGGEIFP